MTTRLAKTATFRDRLFNRLVIQPDGCVVWTGYKLKGYGRIRQDERTGQSERYCLTCNRERAARKGRIG